MIKDSIANFRHFIKIRPAFEKAFEFLSRKDLKDFPDGKYVIEGKRLFVTIARSQGKGVQKALLEAHRKYIDIQFTISGKELIGLKRAGECKNKLSKYNPEKDVMFFSDKPEKYIKLKPGDFVVLFPEDAHAPLSGKGDVHKAVVKVAVT